MNGVYTYNKLFDTYCLKGREDLPRLENDVLADDVVVNTVFENYETALEDDWANFIKDFNV
ncbi:MAG: hypothetical protein LBO68_04695 [Synergistaceae bacterium]|nr:hypothetical protein [Synergistaceae bacterium]